MQPCFQQLIPACTHGQVREPTAAVFSAESMLRGMGVSLPWSLAQPLDVGDCSDPEAAVGAQAALLQVRARRAAWSPPRDR